MSYAELRAIHHDHEYVRQSLTLIRAALTCRTTPPDGHAYWCIVRDAATYLATELPRHMAVEEAQVFPLYAGRPGAERLEELCAEHRELAALASDVMAAVSQLAPGPIDRRWANVRALAAQLEAMLSGHMDSEEALLRKLARSEPVAAGCAG